MAGDQVLREHGEDAREPRGVLGRAARIGAAFREASARAMPETIALKARWAATVEKRSRPAGFSRFLIDATQARTGIDTLDLFDLITNFGATANDNIAPTITIQSPLEFAVEASRPQRDATGSGWARN